MVKIIQNNIDPVINKITDKYIMGYDAICEFRKPTAGGRRIRIAAVFMVVRGPMCVLRRTGLMQARAWNRVLFVNRLPFAGSI